MPRPAAPSRRRILGQALERLRARLPAPLRSRRGNVAVLVAVTGPILVGMAAYAIEGSRYYRTSQDTQNAADLSAMAAASAYQFRGRTAALGAATEVAGRNGFGGARITVNNPPLTGSQAGNTQAFEVTIQTSMPLVLSNSFVGRNQAQVTARAVSVLHGTTPACILALSGALTIQNSSSFSAPGCAIGSNAPGASIVIPQSNSTVQARGAITFGTCSGCNNTRWRFTEGYQEHSPPLSNPYDRLDSKSYVRATGASCLNTGPLEARGPIQPTGMTRAYCADVNISNTSSVTLASGTYVFQNASFNVGSISNLSCTGCTFIFRGTNPGNLNLGNLSTATLTAPSTNNDDADYDGILFHRMGGTMGSSSAPNLNLQSVSSFNLAGGIYFPNSFVKIGNLSSASSANCLALVGGAVEISSLSSYSFSVANCASYRTGVPMARLLRLVE